MAKQRKVVKNGRTRWRVSWYDAVGQRRQRFFKLKGDADRQLSAAIAAEDQRCAPMIDPSATVRAYAAYWLPVHATTRNLKARTVEGYEDTLALHVLDFQLAGSTKPIGDFRMARLTRLIGKRLIAAHRQQGNLGERSVGNIHAIVSAMCNGAVADGLLPANPMAGLRKELRLAPSVQARAEQIKAFTQDQLDTFLAKAQELSPLCDLYLTLARTGLRLGEGLALQDTDPEVFDFTGRTLRVVRALGKRGALDTPKSGHAREVDLSQELVAVLRARIVRKKQDTLAHGWRALPPWTFYTSNGTAYSHRNVLRDFKRVLEKAKLPLHFSPHSLRHTFASLHILDGAKPVWLQQQLGHSSLQLTLGTYGKWFRLRDHAAADRQDARSTLVIQSATSGDPSAVVTSRLPEAVKAG